METASASPRLLSLDFFRGLTVMIMILVNNPGDWGHIYAPLEHAAWNGCTVADLVFPFFLFIMGVSTVYALQNKKATAGNHLNLILKVLKRSAIILALGWFMSAFWFWDLSTLRLTGVLARIAVVYLISGLIYIKTGVRAQAVLFAGLLVLYYILLNYVTVPGGIAPNLNPETNLGAWLDRTLIGTAHLWKESRTWDPEGLLSSLPAVATALLGLLTGTWLKRKDKPDTIKIYTMLITGVLVTAAGLLWHHSFPINKSLWTSSYVLFTGGLALLSLALCYWLIDVQGYRWFTTPFVVYGINAITVFVLSGLIARTMNMIKVDHQGKQMSLKNDWYHTAFSSNLPPYQASLAWAVCVILVWMIILWVMYKRGVTIKV